MTRKKAKGVGLLSGGLDSMLAAKVLQAQAVEVICVTFTTMFFDAGPGVRAGTTLGTPVHILDISEKHLAMLKKPVYGYGRQMNPCIDCHALMLQEAGRFMEEQGADFLFTGEVLGQRPMSQRRDALNNVEQLAGYPGRILRPLSARLLPPTVVEIEGLIDREQLLDLQGRSRKPQMALALAYGINDYPQPGGGCMLTKEGFGKKLARLLELFPHAATREVELLKWGRHFILPGGSMCVVGRNRADNLRLESLAAGSDILLRSVDRPGPVGLLLPSSRMGQDLDWAALAVIAYSDTPLSAQANVEWQQGQEQGTSTQCNLGKNSLKAYQV
jgi:tRNA-uridine 2-sulfurtransferase